MGNRVPIKDDRNGDMRGAVADRGLSLKFLSGSREVLGNPGIEHSAAVLKESHEEDVA
jgi:hypothetical protein